MSQEDLQNFLKAVRENPSLQEKLQAEGADPVAIAAEAGFTITRPDLIRAEAARIEKLSDEDLEDAAGGGLFDTENQLTCAGPRNLVEGYGPNVGCTRNTSTLGYRSPF